MALGDREDDVEMALDVVVDPGGIEAADEIGAGADRRVEQIGDAGLGDHAALRKGDELNVDEIARGLAHLQQRFQAGEADVGIDVDMAAQRASCHRRRSGRMSACARSSTASAARGAAPARARCARRPCRRAGAAGTAGRAGSCRDGRGRRRSRERAARRRDRSSARRRRKPRRRDDRRDAAVARSRYRRRRPSASSSVGEPHQDQLHPPRRDNLIERIAERRNSSRAEKARLRSCSSSERDRGRVDLRPIRAGETPPVLERRRRRAGRESRSSDRARRSPARNSAGRCRGSGVRGASSRSQWQPVTACSAQKSSVPA